MNRGAYRDSIVLVMFFYNQGVACRHKNDDSCSVSASCSEFHSYSGFCLPVHFVKENVQPLFLAKYAGNIYRIPKMTDVALLCMGIPIILLNYSNIAVTALSIFIWLFSVIE